MISWCEPDDCPAEICGGPHVRLVNGAGGECIAPAGGSSLPWAAGYHLPPDTPEMAGYQEASNELHDLTGD